VAARRPAAPGVSRRGSAPNDRHKEEAAVKVAVTLNPAHPTGTYRRCGFVFSSSTPTVIDVGRDTREQLDRIAKDPWLTVREHRETPEAP
jgi:hypothetical protein